MKRHFPLLATAVATLFAVGGSLFANDAPKAQPKPQPFKTPVVAKNADFAERQLAFALTTLHRAVETETANANTVVAPFGAYRVLSALSLGSAGQTKTEIDAALFRANVKDDAWKKEIAEANAALTEAPETTLVGALWTAPGYELKKEFAGALKKLTGQKASPLDFGKAEAVQEANAWFSENTKERIAQLFDSLPAETRLLLADATTFDGKWKTAFNTEKTKSRAFVALSGKEVKIATMSQEAQFPYCETEDFQYLEAPYDGDRFSLVVVLPKAGASYAKVERSLTPKQLLECRKEAKAALLDLRLPKFQVERSYDLAATLQKSGVVSAFGLDADLTPIAGDANLCLDQAKQGVFLAVDEAGTIAAAATAVSAAPKAVATKFHANRPFFYMIRHNESGAVLFAGRFVAPQGEEAAEAEEAAKPEADEEADKPEAAEEADKPEADEETAKPEAAEEADKPEAAEEADKPEAAEEADKPEAAEEADKPEAEEEADQPEADEEADKPEADEEADKPEVKPEVKPKKNSNPGTIR